MGPGSRESRQRQGKDETVAISRSDEPDLVRLAVEEEPARGALSWDAFVVMRNHVHAMIIISDGLRRGEACLAPTRSRTHRDRGPADEHHRIEGAGREYHNWEWVRPPGQMALISY